MNNFRKLLKILEEWQIYLPGKYINLLEKKPFRGRIHLLKNQEDFHLYTLPQLCEQVTIDGIKLIRAKELTGHINTLKEFLVDEENTSDGNGNDFPIDRLLHCITIGSREIEILFSDPNDNNSLWIFHPDGGDVQQTGFRLDHLMD